MAEYQYLGDELTVDWRCRWSLVRVRCGAGGLGQDDHSFSDVFAANTAECEGGGLAGAGDWDWDALALYGPDCCVCELAEGVRTYEDGIACVDGTLE